jgi:hypothetical protein
LTRAQDQHGTMARGLADAVTLQELITLMLAEMGQRTEQIVEAQDNALAVVTRQVRSETNMIMTSLAATVAESILIQQQLVGLNGVMSFMG